MSHIHEFYWYVHLNGVIPESVQNFIYFVTLCYDCALYSPTVVFVKHAELGWFCSK